MLKSLQKYLFVIAAIGLMLIGASLFVIQTIAAQIEQNEVAGQKLQEAVNDLKSNDETVAALKENLSSDYLSKAKAFAYMLKENPGLLYDNNELERVRDILQVDELHVTDENGVLWWGTVESYYGFDFAASEQTKPFMDILQDPSLELAQEPQINGTEGILFQYIGVARQDSKGIVQIGMQPKRLEEQLKNNTIGSVLNGLTFGQGGFIFAINKEDKTLAAYSPDTSLLGKSIEELGIQETKLKDGGKGFLRLEGQKLYYNTLETDTYYLAAAVPKAELYGNRNIIMALTVLVALAVFGFFIFAVQRIVNRNIITSISNIAGGVDVIASGDMSASIEERRYPEFAVLSEGINKMVASIEEKNREAMGMIAKQEELFGEITKSSEAIAGFSGKMQDVSRAIAGRVEEQSSTIGKLSGEFSAVAGQAAKNSSQAGQAAEISAQTEQHLMAGSEKMKEMQGSMEQISDVSKQIGHIIKTIDDIAFQTNILALNAAVEAARAGEHGKGFAVVADEVRSLANKSAVAAKDTASLIDSTLQAISRGSIIAGEASATFESLMEETKESNRIMHEIFSTAKAQAEEISGMNASVLQVAGDIQQNTDIAKDAEETSVGLGRESGILKNLVRKDN